MPLRDFLCSGCQKEQERFYHAGTNFNDLACEECRASCLLVLERSDEGRRRQYAKSVFPFTTTHIDAKGQPMEITSMGHLRQVEARYGVVLSAFSQDRSNLDPIKDPPRYRVNDPDFGR